MFSDNHKISNNQIKKMLVFDIASIAILVVPGIAASGAGRDGLLSILLGSAAALLYALLLLYFTRHIKGDYLSYSKEVTGRIITTVFGLLYLIKILFSCVFTLSLFTKVITDTLLPDTNYKIIVFTLIFIGIYTASKGVEVRARIAEILFYIVLIPLLILFFLSIWKIDYNNLFPLFTTSTAKIATTGYSVLLTYSAIELLIFAIPKLTEIEKSKGRKRYIVQTILIAAVINIVLFVLVEGFLGASAAGQDIWSSLSIMQMLEIPGGFIQRQDAIIFTLWLASIFTIISTYFYYLGKITNDLIKLKKKNLCFILFGILLFFLTTNTVSMEDLFSVYSKYLAFVGFPQSILIPLIIIVVAKIRFGKTGGPYEKE